MLELKAISPNIVIELSVSEVSKQIKDLLEEKFSLLRVKGEISGLKIHSSGHIYFSLKDKDAVLNCVCWKRSLASFSIPLTAHSEGLEVSILGKITSYAGQSKYQLIVEKIEPAGIGAIMQLLKERREKLEKEGLFDLNRKKPIPKIPNVIGIITSTEGAVIRDIIHRIRARYPTHIVIWATSVQGNFAAQQVSTGIEEFNKLNNAYTPDVIIIARGGGSIEDLWAFNEEIVLRAVANSRIPIVSAIGHANDRTLIDDVADLSAPTPTAAAEIITPNKDDLDYKLKNYNQQLNKNLEKLITLASNNLDYHKKILQRANLVISHSQQKIDDLTFKLNDALPNLLKFKIANLMRFSISKLSLDKNIQYKKLQLSNKTQILSNKIKYIINQHNNNLKLFNSLLSSLDYNNVLKRGFAIVTNSNGNIITSVKQTLYDYNKLNIKFADGELSVKKLK